MIQRSSIQFSYIDLIITKISDLSETNTGVFGYLFKIQNNLSRNYLEIIFTDYWDILLFNLEIIFHRVGHFITSNTAFI